MFLWESVCVSLDLRGVRNTLLKVFFTFRPIDVIVHRHEHDPISVVLVEQLQHCVSWENVSLELDLLSVDSIQFLIVLGIHEPSKLFFFHSVLKQDDRESFEDKAQNLNRRVPWLLTA